jgi:hypothetical protein
MAGKTPKLREAPLPRLSASKLKLYEACPKRYAWRYVLGHKDYPNIYGFLGSSVHKAIQNKYLNPEGSTAYYFQQAFSSMLSPDIDQANKAQDLYAQAMLWIEAFDHSQYSPLMVDGKPVLEKYFRLPYSIDGEPICTLEGYIDFVGDTGGSLFAVDWKTGKEVYSKRKVQKDLQFIIYAWALEQLYHRKPDYIIYHRLRSQTKYAGYVFDRSSLDAIILRLLQDPLEYTHSICSASCPSYCGVRKYASETKEVRSD